MRGSHLQNDSKGQCTMAPNFLLNTLASLSSNANRRC